MFSVGRAFSAVPTAENPFNTFTKRIKLVEKLPVESEVKPVNTENNNF